MKSISTLAIIGLLFFACKLCSFTGNTNRPITTSSPSPSLMYARDFIKQHPGRPYTLIKSHFDKEEIRKTATGFTVKLIENSNDTAGGEYEFYSGGTRSAVLMVCNYSNPETASSLVDEFEANMRSSRAWNSVRTIPRQTGKRVEGIDGRGNGLVIWNNGYWVFLTIGKSLADVSSLADGVGY
jgi:hypothetical protein